MAVRKLWRIEPPVSELDAITARFALPEGVNWEQWADVIRACEARKEDWVQEAQNRRTTRMISAFGGCLAGLGTLVASGAVSTSVVSVGCLRLSGVVGISSTIAGVGAAELPLQAQVQDSAYLERSSRAMLAGVAGVAAETGLTGIGLTATHCVVQ